MELNKKQLKTLTKTLIGENYSIQDLEITAKALGFGSWNALCGAKEPQKIPTNKTKEIKITGNPVIGFDFSIDTLVCIQASANTKPEDLRDQCENALLQKLQNREVEFKFENFFDQDSGAYLPEDALAPTDEVAVFICDNCSWEGSEEATNPAKDLSMRLATGSTYTDCECPECGALAYPNTLSLNIQKNKAFKKAINSVLEEEDIGIEQILNKFQIPQETHVVDAIISCQKSAKFLYEHSPQCLPVDVKGILKAYQPEDAGEIDSPIRKTDVFLSKESAQNAAERYFTKIVEIDISEQSQLFFRDDEFYPFVKTEIHVTVKAHGEVSDSDDKDEGIDGLEESITKFLPKNQEAAMERAKDWFHNNYAIACLEDFEITITLVPEK
jgi:hypothetical protein